MIQRTGMMCVWSTMILVAGSPNPAQAAWYDSCYSTAGYTDWKAKVYSCHVEPNAAMGRRFDRLTKAREYYRKKEYRDVLPFVDHVIIHHSQRARAFQNALTGQAGATAEDLRRYEELHAVGAALVIKGLAYMELGDMDRAEQALTRQIRHYTDARCWDPQGGSMNLNVPAQALLAEIRRWRE